MIFTQGGNTLAITGEIATGTTGHAASGQIMLDAIDAGYGGVVQPCGQAAAIRHLDQMPQQTEAGHVGHGGYAFKCGKALSGAVQSTHEITGNTHILSAQLALFLGSGQYADTQWFSQVKVVTGFSSVIALELIPVDTAGHGQAKDGFRGINRMAARQRHASQFTD